jgi:DNA-binding NtrC family response regulator
MLRRKILIIDGNSYYRNLLAESLNEADYEAEGACGIDDAFHLLSDTEFYVILLALNTDTRDKFEDLKIIKERFPYIQVIVLAGQPDTKTAFNALKLGAFDFLGKSPNIEEFIPVIDEALKRAKKEIKKSRKNNDNPIDTPIVGGTPQIKSVLDIIRKVANTDLNVLVLGETGVGKELVAQTIYRNSLRADGEFVAVNCGAIPDNLLESEIFGHEKGAYTDAVCSRAGLLEEARGGTIFLDEISEISPAVQVKLLRTVETRKFRRLGSNREIKTNARIISATNKELNEEVKKKTFRDDLYYRLAGVVIKVPPLRERKEDIPFLTEYFMKMISSRVLCGYSEIKKKTFTPSAMNFLKEYNWPGNIRELKNVIERIIVLSENQSVTPSDVAQAIPGIYSWENISRELKKTEIPSLHENEKNHIRNVLNLCNGHKHDAAKILGISPRTLCVKLRQHNINADVLRKM